MRRIVPPVLIATALLLASCSSSDGGRASDGDAGKATTTAAATSTTGSEATDVEGHACDKGSSTKDLQVEPVSGTPGDLTMTSFDGTEIRIHWFPVDGASKAEPKPTILMGPGWSLSGDTDTRSAPLFGALSIKSMRAAGYNVLTWDPRGFGQSEGKATVNDPTKEGRDVQAMLDFVAQQPEAQLDDAGDPRTGMVGFSYGGGIQLTLAAIDCRVDAIVPGIAWHSLETSLYKADTVKSGWSRILTSTVSKDRLDPHIVSATASGLSDGSLSDEDHDWFLSRGPGDMVEQVDIPTLFVQGTVDTLFTLDEAITNYEILKANKVPTAMLWFCGGHGTCLTKSGDGSRVSKASFAWLDRYLKGDTSTPEQPALDLVDQDGTAWTSKIWPLTFDAEEVPAKVTGTGSGDLDLSEDSASGGIAAGEGSSDPMAGLVSGITPSRADRALEVETKPIDDDVLLVGAPTLKMTYSGTLPEGETDGRVFAQLVDDDSGLVLGNQITPIAVVLDGDEHTVDIPLEVIAHHLASGATLTLQIVATTSAYATPQLGGTLTASKLTIDIPVTDPSVVRKG